MKSIYEEQFTIFLLSILHTTYRFQKKNMGIYDKKINFSFRFDLLFKNPIKFL